MSRYAALHMSFQGTPATPQRSLFSLLTDSVNLRASVGDWEKWIMNKQTPGYES